MGRAEKSIEIKAPLEKVWEILAFDRLPKWDEGWGDPERVEYTSEVNTHEDKYRVGATAHGIPKKQGDDYCRFEITESLEHEKIKFRAWENPKYFGILAMLQTFTLEPVGTDTKFTYEQESDWSSANFPIGIFGKFLEKLYLRRWAGKRLEKNLEVLKTILEK